MKNKLKLIALLALISLSTPMTAQQKLFTLEELNFGGRNFHKLRPQNLYLTWWGEQLMEQDAEEGRIYGEKEPLFKLSEIDGDWHSAYDARYPYADQPLVLLNNGRKRVLFDFKKKQIAWSQDSQGEQNSHWSKASRATAYTRDGQLFVRTSDNEERQLTTDGSREIVYGEAVHRNEFGIDEGLFWSPNGLKLAFYRMDQSMVTDYPQVNIDPRVAQLEPDKYPMAGMTSHKVTVGIYDVLTKQTLYLQAGDPTDRYFTNIAWSPDSKTVYMQELNRQQNDCRLVSYNAETGERLAELYRETSTKYVEPLNPIRFLPWDSNLFIMQSQRDGYNHLYLYNIKGELQKQLTAGPWVVKEMLGFNLKQKSIIIRANKEHPLHQRLYSVNMAGGMKQIETTDGVHNGQLSAAGSRLIDRFSTPTRARVIDLIDLSKKQPRHTTLLEAEDPWKDYQQPIFECGSIKAADGVTDLYYRMVKPSDFDPNKKYPTVVYVYGGPHAHNVDASWHWASRPWETYMAQKGYIVFILDNRGSENRGRDFEQATFHQLGQIEMQDQMKGVDYLRSLPYIDMQRLGVHGWSYGGFMTISLLTNYPNVSKVGVAGGPVIDWKWYEVMYGERYMDTPQTNPEGYEQTSLLNKAKDLKGRLQIIIGLNDPTVVPQHAYSFLKACIAAGTQPDFYVYPGQGHNMRGHQSVHLHERITRYFDDYLK